MNYAKPGSSPGLSVTATTDESAQAVRVNVIAFDRDQLTEVEMDLADVQPPAPGDPRVMWVRLLAMPDPASLARFGQRWGLDPLDLEDVVQSGQRPKTEFHERETFTILQCPYLDEAGSVHARQVSLFHGAHYVISIVEPGPLLFDPVLDRLRLGDGDSRIRSLGAGYLLYALIDATVDYAFPVLDGIEETVDGLETELLGDPDSVSLDSLHRLRSDLTALRRFQRPAREAIERLRRHENSPIDKKIRSYLRDVDDHQTQVNDGIEALRENAVSLQELYLSLQGHRLNDVMKVLTIISTIFIPMSFLTGLYGMNFDPNSSPYNMPELDNTFAYPMLLGVLVLIVISMLVFFRRRRWI